MNNTLDAEVRRYVHMWERESSMPERQKVYDDFHHRIDNMSFRGYEREQAITLFMLLTHKQNPVRYNQNVKGGA